MTAKSGMCNDYPGNVFGTGSANHGNDARGYRISGAFSRYSWAAQLADITDGTSNVIAIGEQLPHKSDQQRSWMLATTIPPATSGPINFPVRGFGEPGFPGPDGCHAYNNWQTSNAFRSAHRGGAHFIFADGSVDYLSEMIDYHAYQRLGDRRDGQPTWRNKSF